MIITIIGWFIVIIALCQLINTISKKQKYKMLFIILNIILLIIGVYMGGHAHRVNTAKTKAYQFDRIGYPINHDKLKKNSVGYYYSKDATTATKLYYTNSDNKINSVAFKEGLIGVYDSKSEMLQNFKKVSAKDLKHTSGRNYYSKSENKHYWVSAEYNSENGGYGFYSIHLASEK